VWSYRSGLNTLNQIGCQLANFWIALLLKSLNYSVNGSKLGRLTSALQTSQMTSECSERYIDELGLIRALKLTPDAVKGWARFKKERDYLGSSNHARESRQTYFLTDFTYS
jgi:hypothetical protein